MTMDSERWLEVEVREAIEAGRDTLLIELASRDASLPPYEAGAHVAVRCDGETIRYYSLTGPRTDPATYRLGVKLAPDTRGGSRWIFDHAVPGRRLRISEPRNHFPLAAGQPSYLLLSGGIGATPIVSMLYELRASGVRARWVHLCRSPEDVAFQPWIRELSEFHDVHVHVDSEAGGLYDLKAELERACVDTAVYCCGPAPLMSAVQAFGECNGRAERFHFEFFSPPAPPAAQDDVEFEVIQNSTGRRIPVAKDKTMLAALRDAGLQMQSECEYGVCGWCAVPVVGGEPKHFDSYLTASEREANQLVLPCVSRCASRTITLDI
jgi:ferredoxin-NADP reductase